MASDLLASALAERYHLLRELGGGGSATVYLAQDQKHGREVAIKVLRPEFAVSLAAERFLREIATVARLQHPHIVPLLDSGSAGGFLYFVMPYIEGDTLRYRLARSGRLPVADVIHILADVADAVAYAHDRGVVHRDLKPENILLSGRHALVTDFGVARAASLAAEQTPLTVGVALGTPAYMSPEQAVASPDVDHRADIYALGVLGYELLTGRAPFTAATPQEVLTMHVAVRPEPIESHRPEVPADLSQVIMRCLEKRPEARWSSASELVAVLEPLTTPSGGITPTGLKPAVARAARWSPVVAGILLVAALALVLWPRTVEEGPPAGVTQQQLTYLGNVIDAAPSPDGLFLAYTLEDSIGERIMVRDLLGGNVVTVASSPSFVAIGWLPDGLELWYSTYRPESGVFAVPRLGGSPRPLSREQGVPSPDGTRSAWIRSSPRVVRILGPGRSDSAGIELPFDFIWPLSPAWSSDGTKLAIPLLNQASNRHSLAIVPTRGERPPHEIVVDSIPKIVALWAPDGQSIYYLSLRGRIGTLFRAPVDGQGRLRGRPVEIVTGLEPGTNRTNATARLAISGDGRRLVYVRQQAAANLGLLARGADPRTSIRMLTRGTAEHAAVRLSPDERRLAYVSMQPTGQVMSVRRIDQEDPVMEVAMLGEVYDIGWSPIDERVALAGITQGINQGIRILRPGSAEQRDHLMGVVGSQLDWTPDGRIVYQRSGNQRFGILDPATGRDSTLAQPDGLGWVFNPRVSRDGRLLAFRWNRNGDMGLWVTSLTDTTPRQLVAADIRPVRWSADGRRLWGVERVVGDNRDRLVEISWPEGRRQMVQILPLGFELSDITRDGRTLVITLRERQSDAWLIELPAP